MWFNCSSREQKRLVCAWDFGGLYIKNCKVFNHILENLAIFSQGRNQFFPIVMRAGRDFKGRLINKNFDNHLLLKQSVETIRNFLLKIRKKWNAVIIVIDELDRCTPEYAIKVLERLHHICYDTENDLFQFIQIAAINREELCDSISKTYGRGFIANAFPEIHSSNSYYHKTGSKPFGNYYLQKFIQMIIPIPRGRSKNITQNLLNDFQNKFTDNNDAYRNLIMDLFELPFSEVSMRTKEELIEFVQTTHQITLEREFSDRADNIKPSLVVLCVEIIDVFCRGIMRTRLPKIQQELSHDVIVSDKLHRRSNSGIISLEIKCRDEFVYNSERFATSIFEMFKTETKPQEDVKGKHTFVSGIRIPEMGFSNTKDEKFTFRLDNPRAEALWYYLGENEKFQLEDGIPPNEMDIKFVEAFRKTLNILT